MLKIEYLIIIKFVHKNAYNWVPSFWYSYKLYAIYAWLTSTLFSEDNLLCYVN